jgi:hypothetical protein
MNWNDPMAVSGHAFAMAREAEQGLDRRLTKLEAAEAERAEWKRRMEPVAKRIPLKQVAEWWLDMWQWRTGELNAGRGNPYDAHPSYRAPWSLVITKYPWIDTTVDRLDLTPLVKAGMKKRSKNNPEMMEWYKALVKEEKHFESARRL